MMLDNPNKYALPGLGLYTTTVIDMHFADQDGNHDFIIGKDPVYSEHMHYFMKKGTLYQSDFNVILSILNQNGILAHLIQNWRKKAKNEGRNLARIQNRTSRPKPDEILTNENLIGAYILSGIMIGVSVVCLILECIFKPKGRKKHETSHLTL